MIWEYNEQLVRDDKYPRAEVTRGTRGYLSHAYNTWFTVTKYIVMMSKSASTKIVNFMAPGSGVLVLGWGSK